MANPNPNPATRFGAGQANGSRGRQKAARDKISAALLEALSDAFNEPNDEGGSKGLDALKKVRDEDPATYARIFCHPHAEAGRNYGRRSISNLTDEQLEAYCVELERQIAERAARAATPPVITAGSQRAN